tara:strand:- start:10056 stop:10256 length:201 start_codon:yes stop_codon:yes gene_type:complete
MKRLTVHLKRVNKKTEVIEGKSVSKIFNTLSYQVKDDEDAQRIITQINENEKPRNNVKKWYLTNLK